MFVNPVVWFYVKVSLPEKLRLTFDLCDTVILVSVSGAVSPSVQYLLWTLLWVGWNVFVSCLYLDLGGLSKVSTDGSQTWQIIRELQ